MAGHTGKSLRGDVLILIWRDHTGLCKEEEEHILEESHRPEIRGEAIINI